MVIYRLSFPVSVQERETSEKVRVSQEGGRESGASERDSNRGLREVEVKKQLKMRKSSFLKLPPTSLRKSGQELQFCRVHRLNL